MSKLIAIKEGTKTRYLTQEAYNRYLERKKDRKVAAGDITCSDSTFVGMGFTDEQWNRIHKKGKEDE